MINFVPNDPRAGSSPPMRRVAARPDRPTARAAYTVAGNDPQAVYAPGTPGFIRWQARQAATLAVETWETVLGTPIASWAAETTNPKSLLLLPDAGDDLNAYYDRDSLSFFHHQTGTTVTQSGASTDVVSHEAGHAILDAKRPDLWDTPYLEVGGFHEAFGDIVAIVTALRDSATRRALLAASPDLGTANFVEATAEDLSNGIRLALGASHPASKPRRALNTFLWQLPSTMPTWGGPDDMIAEVHSIARIMTGCFYDLLRGMFTAAGPPTSARLWTVTRRAAALLYEGAATAPEVPRFFRSVGRAMVMADDTQNAGANRALISQAFANHGIALGTNALLSPEAALAGTAPKVDRRRGTVSLQAATMRELRRRLGIAAGTKMQVDLLPLAGKSVAKVKVRTSVGLGSVDKSLNGVVALVDVPILVGASGGSAALLDVPFADNPAEEVHDFVRVLLAHDQLDLSGTGRRPRRRAASPEASTTTTHAVERHGGRKELRRVRVVC
jgi:hypothetical protein